MRKIVLSTVAMVLIAMSVPQAFAAQPHRARKATPAITGEEFRNARNSLAQPSQPAWHYSGWSAPAGH